MIRGRKGDFSGEGGDGRQDVTHDDTGSPVHAYVLRDDDDEDEGDDGASLELVIPELHHWISCSRRCVVFCGAVCETGD